MSSLSRLSVRAERASPVSSGGNLMRLDSREEVQTGVVRQAGAVLFNAARAQMEEAGR
jgi:hypothetical protein